MNVHLDLAPSVPLIVDLDGTLIRADSLHENLIAALFRRPHSLFATLRGATSGRAAFKQAVAGALTLDAAGLHYRAEVLALVRDAKAAGRSVHLVTAADQSIADSVQSHLGCFDSVKGSDGRRNLKGRRKLAWLQDAFPEGFAYAGDSAADLPIWEAAKGAILVGPGVNHAPRLREAGVAVQTIEDEQTSPLKDWLGELRLHQWAKNVLLFVPLLLGHIASDIGADFRTVIAFFAFGLVASATYVINDLADLGADRQHPTKRFRALAAGRIPVAQGVAAAAGLLIIGFTVALILKLAFAAAMAIYFVLTLAYSFRLKSVPLLDVAVIGALFTLRVVMGTVLNGLAVSPWLISFSAFLFFSLSLAKRHVEIMRAQRDGLRKIPGRGYRREDWPLTLGFGVATAMASIVIMLLFVGENNGAATAYASPQWLYVAPVCVFIWVLRIWLLSHRMELDDDPVAFALKDYPSYALGAIILAGFALAL